MFVSLLGRHVGADLADQHLALRVARSLPGQVQEIAHLLGVHVAAERRPQDRKGDLQLGKPLFNAHDNVSFGYGVSLHDGACAVREDRP